MTLPQRLPGSQELREEVRHTLAARQELGTGLDDELVDSLAQRIQGLIAQEVSRQVGTRSQDSKQILDWRKEMYGITIGCGIPLLAIGAFAGGLMGIVVVCVLLAIVSVAWTGRFR